MSSTEEVTSRNPPAVNPLTVVYGSETGTAQEVAEYVATLARRRGFDAHARALDSIPNSQILGSVLAVFIVSTTGDGEVPSNMSGFWRFLLRRRLPADLLANMRFAVFGLGDSGYIKYNATARKLHARLLQLGATELVERGLGDDQSPRGMWGDLDPWLTSLWSSLLEIRPLPKGAVVDDTPRLEPALFTMTPVESFGGTQERKSSAYDERDLRSSREAIWDSAAPLRREGHVGGAPGRARLLVNRRLTADDHFQEVRHLEFNVAGVHGGADYRAGDVAWVHPPNDASAVARCAVALGLEYLDQPVRIAPVGPMAASGADDSTGAEQLGDLPLVLPSVCTPRLLLTEALDISGTPRRSFFERLSVFASDADEKEKLEELASPAGADLLNEYATREKRSYVEVLEDFPSCRVPPERILELIPRLRPRGFSIASSALETPSALHLCVAVVSFRTPYKRLRTGVCSSWLASLAPGAEVPLSIRLGSFRLPESPDHPLVMVGPGTGVAPMRSVILERRRQREKRKKNGASPAAENGTEGEGPERAHGLPPPDTLFFGCRHPDIDFYYQGDWEELQASGDLSLHTAFSRQNPSFGRVYVQRRVREQATSVAMLIVERGANVLVSGSAKQMPRDVWEAFRDALAGHVQVGDKHGAERLLKTMERQGRYCVEGSRILGPTSKPLMLPLDKDRSTMVGNTYSHAAKMALKEI